MQVLHKDNIDPDRAGVVFGSGIGGVRTFQEEVIDFAKGDGTPRFNPFFIPKMIFDIAAGQISIRHGFQRAKFCCCKCLRNQQQCYYGRL